MSSYHIVTQNKRVSEQTVSTLNKDFGPAVVPLLNACQIDHLNILSQCFKLTGILTHGEAET